MKVCIAQRKKSNMRAVAFNLLVQLMCWWKYTAVCCLPINILTIAMRFIECVYKF